ncbi:GTP-binding protein [soil metagenome]
MPRIPTNVITGFLGVGKTTAILDLLASNPHERWAVLVNEYGEVSIDQAILAGGNSGENVTVREVAGGCVCCATAPYLPVALHLLLTEAKPTRLIIETTGLGHPGRLLDTLRANYQDRLDVRATLTLVAPDDVTNEFVHTNPIFREQVDIADVIVLNKLDAAKPGDLEAYQRWANDLFPPKLLIAATAQGRLNPVWLDLGGTRTISLSQDHPTVESGPILELIAPKPGHPQRHESPGVACGWRFHADDIFDEGKLLAYLGNLPGTTRLKGVFRVEDDRIVINRSGGHVTVTPTHYRHDSRVEIFSDSLNWNEVEAGLRQCIALLPATV